MVFNKFQTNAENGIDNLYSGGNESFTGDTFWILKPVLKKWVDTGMVIGVHRPL
jgi:hypothetical protein